MSKNLNPERALIFRITHIGNLARILKEGCHCRSSTQQAQPFVEIGNQELIQKRIGRPVPCGPNGTLSDYVPFYFTPYTPMLYNIKTGWGVPKQPLTDIVIMTSSLYTLREQGVPFVFSDRHAYLKTARFSNDLEDLEWIIWKTLQARDFRRDDLDKFEKYQAEALVYKHVPLGALLGIVCMNEHVRSVVTAQAERAGASVRVLAQPNWYL